MTVTGWSSRCGRWLVGNHRLLAVARPGELAANLVALSRRAVAENRRPASSPAAPQVPSKPMGQLPQSGPAVASPRRATESTEGDGAAGCRGLRCGRAGVSVHHHRTVAQDDERQHSLRHLHLSASSVFAVCSYFSAPLDRTPAASEVPGSVRFRSGNPRGFSGNAGLCGGRWRVPKRLVCRIIQRRAGSEGSACHAEDRGFESLQPLSKRRAFAGLFRGASILRHSRVKQTCRREASLDRGDLGTTKTSYD
jgi:hypothetical protein